MLRLFVRNLQCQFKVLHQELFPPVCETQNSLIAKDFVSNQGTAHLNIFVGELARGLGLEFRLNHAPATVNLRSIFFFLKKMLHRSRSLHYRNGSQQIHVILLTASAPKITDLKI